MSVEQGSIHVFPVEPLKVKHHTCFRSQAKSLFRVFAKVPMVQREKKKLYC